MKHVLVTGGAGFIGSHLTDKLLQDGHKVVVLDDLTYAGSMANLAEAEKHSNFVFVKESICNTSEVLRILQSYEIDIVYNLAAETHVDNSINAPAIFIQTNIVGTYSLLSAALSHFSALKNCENFKFIHVSTDEVFGQLDEDNPPFTVQSPYSPRSPYAASKAGADHLVRAWFHTYGLPTIVTHCSNNFGPRQHNEKFIPTVIRLALNHQPIPIYGTGKNIRDWLFVEDHCHGLSELINDGRMGETYAFAGDNELRNIDLAHMICGMLDELVPISGKHYRDFITFVEDRKGHDWRYALKSYPQTENRDKTDFLFLLRKTVGHYLTLCSDYIGVVQTAE